MLTAAAQLLGGSIAIMTTRTHAGAAHVFSCLVFVSGATAHVLVEVMKFAHAHISAYMDSPKGLVLS